LWCQEPARRRGSRGGARQAGCSRLCALWPALIGPRHLAGPGRGDHHYHRQPRPPRRPALPGCRRRPVHGGRYQRDARPRIRAVAERGRRSPAGRLPPGTARITAPRPVTAAAGTAGLPAATQPSRAAWGSRPCPSPTAPRAPIPVPATKDGRFVNFAQPRILRDLRLVTSSRTGKPRSMLLLPE